VAGGVHARALAAAALAALAACGPDAEPRLDAACAPDAAMEQVTCKIRNNGTAASRACFTARVQPEAGAPLIARRMCTAVLEPGQATEVKPLFEQLDRVRRADTLVSRCVRQARWTCKIDIVETPREMSGRSEP
jgi:hypothetical protein